MDKQANEKRAGKNPAAPSVVFEEYRAGVNFKQGLGHRGMYEQNKMNERYLVGDQWYGVNCGNDRPLVRHNVIKRIADYKMAVVGSNPIAVNYSADGVPNTLDLKQRVEMVREGLAGGSANAAAAFGAQIGWDGGTGAVDPSAALAGPAVDLGGAMPGGDGFPVPGGTAETVPTDEEVNIVMSALSDYYRVTAERVKFDDIKEQALRDAYSAGTGIVYTWWDDRIRTGLYADSARKTPITGDIACEVLDVENVYFGDPNLDDIQAQPYILIAQRKGVDELRRDAKRHGAAAHEIEQITDDAETGYMAGQRSEDEPPEARKATVVTKLWKEWDKDGKSFKLKAVQVCESATVRPAWEMGIRLYPLAKFTWERRRNCAYGESEVTYLIPNQIAINRMITASVWAVMMMGMPIMVVNGDVIVDEITNDPGQIIRVYGDQNDVAMAARYVNPPNFSPSFDNMIASLISNTLTQAGANDAALGDVRPDNTSAIIAVREAATMPLQAVQNRYYSFCEDIARIWAEFWVMQYGKRSLKVEDDNGTWYFPFDGDRYRDLLISTRIDVGASTLWSESQSIRTLDNLFDRQVIDVLQYLTRMPKGTIPNVTGLIRDIKNANAAAETAAASTAAAPATAGGAGGMPLDAAMAAGGTDPAAMEQAIVSQLPPQAQQMLASLPPQAQAAMVRAALGAESMTPESMPTGQVV